MTLLTLAEVETSDVLSYGIHSEPKEPMSNSCVGFWEIPDERQWGNRLDVILLLIGGVEG